MYYLEGRCPKCGTRYQGWALESFGNQICPHCGVGLENKHRNETSFNGYVPCSVEEHKSKRLGNAQSAGGESGYIGRKLQARLPGKEVKQAQGSENICPQCGARYLGAAFGNQRNQFCVKCGSALEIRKDGVIIKAALAPFKAEEYEVNSHEQVWEDLTSKNLLLYMTMN